MHKVIAVCNQKGGVGKTTTAVNLATAFAMKRRKTLLIDLDPQGNASSGLGIDKNTLIRTVYQVLIGEASLEEVRISTALERLQVVPANSDLVGADLDLISRENREQALKIAVQSLLDQYDFVVIDCPPSLSLLTVNALTAANSVLVPVQCEYYALEGLSSLLKTLQLIRGHLNPTLEIEGVLLTLFDPRNKLSHQVAQEIRKFFKDEVFTSVIPRNVTVSESPSHGKPVLLYDPRSKGALAYLDLASEILKKQRAF